MGLGTTPISDRLLIERPITWSVSVNPVQGQWSSVSLNVTTTYYLVNEIHLYATGAYRYVGCSYAEARSVADALASKLVFPTKYSYWTGTADLFMDAALGETLQADIQIVKQSGHLYDVVVTVNADDVRRRIPAGGDVYQSLFVTERNRDWVPSVS